MINKLYYNDAPEYCHPFLIVASDDLLSELKQSKRIYELIHSITKDNENYRYAPKVDHKGSVTAYNRL
ncbi:MAG: hypothetical protein IPL12_07970 [Bacteroidetes bacterium]|nr:hypothetical protein [Bacteroidota bacterium]